MRHLVLLLGVAAGLFSATALANSQSYYVYADVVDVEPLIQRHTVREPHEECSRESYASSSSYGRNGRSGRHRHHHGGYGYQQDYYRGSHGNGAATLLGGVIGGLVGSQFGGGNGKKVLAITGAMVGASIANQASRRRHETYASHHAPQRCTTVTQSRRVETITGYSVRYHYQGQEFVKRVEEHPGDRIRVRVDVTPVVTEPGW